MTPLLVGVLIGLLLASILGNLALWYTRREFVAAWRDRARAAEDKAHAAELRASQQIDAILDRVRTSDRMTMAGPASPEINPDERKFISDFPHDDDVWNEYRGSGDAE